ncbi:MAG: carboxypeptidase regulatory-like domain-containing protein [Terracidiphilus sp.]
MKSARFTRKCRMPLVWLTVLLSALAARAQVDTGTILGTVTDSTGASVPGATVMLMNQATAAQLADKTTADGRFEFTPLPIGTYTVVVEAPGFKKATVESVHLNIQQQAAVNIVLQPGAVTENVEVTEAPELMQTESSSVGQVIDEKSIVDLPLNGRDYTMLVLLTPGVTLPQQGARATNQFVANGARVAQNDYLLDGIDNNSNSVDYLDGKADVIKPPVDAIAEFKVMTSDFPAEFGRAGGAIVNATLKSGSNQLHGSVWEFFRNDALDAYNDYFVPDATASKKPELRQNQFGATAGGRIWKDKTFWFADYEGTKIREGAIATSQATANLGAGSTPTVPTIAEINSGYTDFADLFNANGSFPRTDLLNRTFQSGQIFDPATTRPVTQGTVDPVTGLAATGTGYVRDPFVNNQIPANRLDPNAIKLLQLFPQPNSSGVLYNYNVVKVNSYDTNTADMRIDERFRDQDQAFFHYDYISSVRIVPPPFDGVADGGGYSNGTEIYNVRGLALGYTHTFSPTLINEARLGYTRGHDTREPSGASTMGIPAQYGITGIPQVPLNGGLPYLGIGTLSGLGGAGWLPGNRFSDTEQMTENLTKVYKKHTFKGGAEFQYIYFPWLAPPASKGTFYWDGNYTSIPQQADGLTGRAQFLLTPENATVPNGVNLSGGMDAIDASNFGTVHANRNYFGTYFQDDWAITRKLTLNLGLRWEHFGLTGEAGGAQANFIQPSLTSNSGAAFYMTAGHKTSPALSSSFTGALAQSGIDLVFTDKYGTGLGVIQKVNFAPRIGFAYSLTPKWVVRGGYGIFYGAFENRGGYPSLGYNYPFQFEVSLSDSSNGGISTVTPVTFTNGSTGTLENGMSGIQLNPSLVSYSGLALRGIQLNYQTPYTEGYNGTVQYQLTQHDSLEAGYVGSQARHLEASEGQNNVTSLTAPGTPITGLVPFPLFGNGMPYYATAGNSSYNSLQTKWVHQTSKGLDVLVGYTLAKALTDAGDSLSGGGISGYRAPAIASIKYDTGLASFNIKNQFVGSGTYALPFGRGKELGSNMNGVEDTILGGWSVNAILTFDSGQPQTISSQIATGSGTGAYAEVVPGVSKYRGGIGGFYNPAAFKDPPVAGTAAGTGLAPLGGPPTQVNGPGYQDFDFSLFKSINVTESSHAEFRAEAFNLTNTPSFNLPGNLSYDGDNPAFGQITTTRSNARELQFALKYYW